MIIEKIIVNILTHELGLKPENIWIYAQNRKLPTDGKELYCTLGCTRSKIISSKSIFVPDDQTEKMEVIERCSVQIDLMSIAPNNEARDRRQEVIMALNSFYAQNLMEQYQVRIFEIPQSLEYSGTTYGGSEVNRYSCVCRCLVKTIKTQASDYYQYFRTNVLSENGEEWHGTFGELPENPENSDDNGTDNGQ